MAAKLCRGAIQLVEEISSAVQPQLNNVDTIVSTQGAFAAITKKRRRVVTWGDSREGGDSSKVRVVSLKDAGDLGQEEAVLPQEGRGDDMCQSKCLCRQIQKRSNFYLGKHRESISALFFSTWGPRLKIK